MATTVGQQLDRSRHSWPVTIAFVLDPYGYGIELLQHYLAVRR